MKIIDLSRRIAPNFPLLAVCAPLLAALVAAGAGCGGDASSGASSTTGSGGATSSSSATAITAAPMPAARARAWPQVTRVPPTDR